MRSLLIVALLSAVAVAEPQPTPLTRLDLPSDTTPEFHLVTIIDGQLSINHGLTKAQCEEILNRLIPRAGWVACGPSGCKPEGDRGYCFK